MIDGIFRDGHPRATVNLAGIEGVFEVEFVIDTGFEGTIAISGKIARQLGGYPKGFTDRMSANGSIIKCPFLLVEIETEGAHKLSKQLF